MQKSKLQLKIQTCLAVVVFIFVATPAFAADVFFAAESRQFPQGQDFLVNVFLNTEGKSVNAVEGNLVFPEDLLDMLEVRDGNSSINLWIKKPGFLTSNALDFSGVTPGGLSGAEQLLFAVVFRAKKGGNGTLQMNELQILQNDGYGTRIHTASPPFSFSISEKFASQKSAIEQAQDTMSPENFTPTITQNQDVFEGKHFLVFAAQDKGSGIDHYEVREGAWARYADAESPFLLQNQALDKKIFVKAVDKNGNERVEVVYPPHWRLWRGSYWVFGIVIMSVVLLLAILWRRPTKYFFF